MRRSEPILVIPTLIILCCLVLSVPDAWSKEVEGKIDQLEEMVEEIDDSTPGVEVPDDRGDWAVRLGLIGGVTPDYEGSNDYAFKFGPYISIAWKDIIFFRGKTLGANIIRSGPWRAGLLLAKSNGRDEDDNDKLEGLDDVDGSIEGGGFVRYRPKPWRFDIEMRQDLGSGHEGAFVRARAGATLPFRKPLGVMMAHATWASNEYMQSFFGISNGESNRSGLETYDTDSGIKDMGLSIRFGTRLWKQWRIGTELRYIRLVGDAEDSPIVDDENQFQGGVVIVYTWGSKKSQKALSKDEDW